MLQRYLLYLLRWQLSTPILAVCVVYFACLGSMWSTVIANLLGGLLFFWVDRFIFSGKISEPIWAVRDRVACVDCGRVARGYRLVLADRYDRRRDSDPEFRCETCSQAKADALRNEGVVIE